MPDFLTLEDILQMHEHQIEKYGGTYGIRDDGLLDSALAMPQAGFGEDYFHQFPFEMAAAYLFHLVQNHPFHDGNKRVGLVASVAFLALNGFRFVASETQAEDLTFAVARGEKDKSEIAEFFRRHTELTDQ